MVAGQRRQCTIDEPIAARVPDAENGDTAGERRRNDERGAHPDGAVSLVDRSDRVVDLGGDQERIGIAADRRPRTERVHRGGARNVTGPTATHAVRNHEPGRPAPQRILVVVSSVAGARGGIRRAARRCGDGGEQPHPPIVPTRSCLSHGEESPRGAPTYAQATE